MSDITESDLDVLRDRLPPVVDAFEHFTYIGSGTFSKVYMANIRVSFYFKILILKIKIQKRPSSKVAIKVITPTSDPSRVFREINFLRKSGTFLGLIKKVLIILNRRKKQYNPDFDVIYSSRVRHLCNCDALH